MARRAPSCLLPRSAGRRKGAQGALIFCGIGVRKTHDLKLLASILPEGWSVGEDVASLADLTVWAVEPRYPGELPEATKEDAEATVEQARKVYEATLKDLEEHSYDQTDDDASDEPAEGETS